jgi:hypothetical protein
MTGGKSMARGNTSGLSLSNRDVSIVLAMVQRGDREHDIAAWFGVNQGRIAEAKAGSHGTIQPASADDLPPSGPPGVKGRRLRGSMLKAVKLLNEKGPDVVKEGIGMLHDGLKQYDTHEG